MKLLVDGREVEAEGSVLDACLKEGANVPHLCARTGLPAAGHCRSCLVEVNGRTVAACTTPVSPGAQVVTQSPKLSAYRADLFALMASEATLRGEAATLGKAATFPTPYVRLASDERRDETHPHLRFDLSACIKCRLCVRACDEVQGQFVYAMTGRGVNSRLSFGPGAFVDTDCVSCGACTQVCPTGAISDRDRLRLDPEVPVEHVKTTCSYCGVGCQLDVTVQRGDVVQIDGAVSPVNREHLCVKGRYAHAFTRHPERLTTPLIRKNGVLTPASWDEAISLVARGFLERRGHAAALSSSRCTNEENYLVQKWFRAGLGTHNVDCCARVCHAPSAAGMRRSFGTGAATNALEDIEKADLLFVAGSNATASHPVTGARIKQAVLQGAKLIVFDPRRTELARLADVHLAPQPGTNVLVLNAIACAILEGGTVDADFIGARTEGFGEYANFVRKFTPESTEAITGVPAALVRRAAALYAEAQTPMQVHGLGMTEHLQGSEGVMLLCNLAMLVGAIGRPGVGVNPLRGQNNVQGAADMGCQPDLLTGYADPAVPEVKARFERIWGRPLPLEAGKTLPKMYEAIDRGELTALYILGEDVVQTDPDAEKVRERLDKLELLVVQEIFLSETAKRAHVVLPGASFLEKDGTFTNGERRVQRVRRAIAPPGDALADWQILLRLMEASGLPQPFHHPREIFAEVSAVAPSLAAATYDGLERQGLQWPVTAVAPHGTVRLHTESFTRGRGAFQCVDFIPSPAFTLKPGQLRLITGRRLEHYNSGSMTRRSENVKLAPDDQLELNPADARAHGIRTGDRVRVSSEFGHAEARAEVSDVVAPGVAFLTFHFPETGTNQVTSDVVDRLADCPEYKLTAVEIRRV